MIARLMDTKHMFECLSEIKELERDYESDVTYRMDC